MKRHLFAAAVALIAMAGSARAQTPEATPATVPAEPTSTTPAVAAPAGDTAAMFGRTGQIAIMTALDDSDLNMHSDVSFLHTSHSMNGGSSASNFSLSPTGHYFVIPNVSVSAGLIIQHGDVPGTGVAGSVSTTVLGILVGAGYNLYLTPMLSVWPQLQIGYAHASFTVLNTDVTASTIPLTISVPFLFHPAEHFFLGLAPILRTQLTSSASAGGMSIDQSKQTDVGLTAVIGGYFGG